MGALHDGTSIGRQSSVSFHQERFLFILFVVVLLGLGVSLGFWAFSPTGPIGLRLNTATPEKTLQTFCTTLMDKEYATGYALTSSHFQQGLSSTGPLSYTKEASYQNYIQFQYENFGEQGAIRRCTFSEVIGNGSILTLTYANGMSSTRGVRLANEGGSWKLDTL